jgi:glycosyltransferase involved in cell wall biosynthesis
MRKIKVIYIQHTCQYDGSTVALQTIIDGLVRLNAIEALVIYSRGGDFKKWLDQNNIRNEKIHFLLHAYPMIVTLKSLIAFVPRILKLLYINHSAKKSIEKIINKFQPDIIHTNVGPVNIGFEAANKKHIPHVWHIREYQILDFNIRFFPSFNSFKKRIKRSYLISITHNLFNYFHMKNNARVIYDGVMEESECQFIIPKVKYFLFVGRLCDAKGTMDLVITFYEFAKINKEYTLLLAGTGTEPYVNALLDFIKSRNIKDRVKLLGYRSDRYDLMGNATALIVPSRNEGFGFITAEAMFNGCLVIGNNTAGTKEIIENSAGNALQYTGKEALLKTLSEVANNGIEYYYEKIKNAQVIACKLYSKEQNTKHLYHYYSQILNECAGRE